MFQSKNGSFDHVSFEKMFVFFWKIILLTFESFLSQKNFDNFSVNKNMVKLVRKLVQKLVK